MRVVETLSMLRTIGMICRESMASRNTDGPIAPVLKRRNLCLQQAYQKLLRGMTAEEAQAAEEDALRSMLAGATGFTMAGLLLKEASMQILA